MSIVMCYVCDKRVDIDYEDIDYEEFNDIYEAYAICSNCYEEREEDND